MYIEELYNLPILDLKSEFERLLGNKTINWFHDKNNNPVRDQICVNTTKDNVSDIHLGRGSLTFDWDNSSKDENGSLVLPKRKKELQESDFTELASPFKNTLFEDAYNSLNEKYILGRVRLMNSKPKTCLSWHKDGTSRVHYPIITQEGCLMIVQDTVKHLDEHKWYFVDTTKPHTALNSSKQERLHLVAVIIGEK